MTNSLIIRKTVLKKPLIVGQYSKNNKRDLKYYKTIQTTIKMRQNTENNDKIVTKQYMQRFLKHRQNSIKGNKTNLIIQQNKQHKNTTEKYKQ